MIHIATELKTSITYTGTGSQKLFDIPFDYLRTSFVKTSVDDVESAYGEDYVIINRQIEFTVAPISGSHVVIYRETTTDRLVSWADASVLKASDMTINQVQQLHILEEQQDWTKTNSIVMEGTVGWNARFHRIINVGDPVEPQDAVTKQYIEDVKTGFISEMVKVKDATIKAIGVLKEDTELAMRKLKDTFVEEVKEIATKINVFVPSIKDGVLSWTNRAGLENPPPVNIKGEPGQAATITIGPVTTGAPGTDAKAENIGTPTDAHILLTIPRGADGDSIPKVPQRLYVDAINGNDENTGLTDRLPLKTINAALQKIPHNLSGQNTTIELASNDEQNPYKASINNYCGGVLQLHLKGDCWFDAFNAKNVQMLEVSGDHNCSFYTLRKIQIELCSSVMWWVQIYGGSNLDGMIFKAKLSKINVAPIFVKNEDDSEIEAGYYSNYIVYLESCLATFSNISLFKDVNAPAPAQQRRWQQGLYAQAGSSVLVSFYGQIPVTVGVCAKASTVYLAVAQLDYKTLLVQRQHGGIVKTGAGLDA